jgi:phenylalanyl-tRNA synthetase beta subunit
MRHNDFENTPMIKLVMGLAIPSMIAQLVNILYSIVDRMFVGQIEEVIEKCAGKNLENYQLFDIYEGNQIEEGFKSVAYKIVFRASDRTLEEADITKAMDKILKGLQELGIELRG